ncbi:MAG: IscS subfamily cysteine desulfurase [Planctomycetes bacterium]|nr:IscS subfamily cysteine desulfurase [Planctomycetota bacterium]
MKSENGERRIYLDNNATTRCDPRVVEAMLPFFTEKYGNSASRNHGFGWEAEEAVEKARTQVAAVIGADAKEIVFTSGATEADNLALKGVAEMYREKGDHIISVPTEHKAIIDTAKHLESLGLKVTWLPVDKEGLIDLDELRRSITEKTILISVMAVNNEVGVIQPLAEIGKIAAEKGVLFHTDAVQAVGKIPIDVNAMGIHLLSMSGHKIYGPKGIGALYVRRRNPRVRVSIQMHGGGHERGYRSGTLAVPLIVGFGKACELAAEDLSSGEIERVRKLRDRLLDGIRARVPESYVNGSLTRRAPNNLNISFAYVEGESLLMGINDIAVSSGSEDLAHTSIRFGLGRFTTEEEVDYTIERLSGIVSRLRELSPLWEMAQEGIDITKVNWQGH